MFFAHLAVFVQRQFFRDVQLVFSGDVILAFTDSTDKSKNYSLFFLGHGEIIKNWEEGIKM